MRGLLHTGGFGLSDARIRERDIFYVIAALCSCLLGVLFYEAPLIVDDLWFMPSVGEGSSFSDKAAAAVSMSSDRLHTDMNRLSNLPVPMLLALCPRWITAVIVAFMSMLAIAAGQKLADIRAGSCASYVWMALFFLLLPWYDYLLTVSYMMNYLMPTVLSLWTLYLTFRYGDKGRKPAPRIWFGLFLLALGAGWSHEGFAAPLLCGIIVYACGRLLWWRRVNPIVGWIIGCVAVGILLVFASPVFSTRTASHNIVADMPLWEICFQLGPSLLLLIIALLLSVKPLLDDFRRPELLAILVVAMASETVAMTFYNGPRTTWCSVLFSLIAIFYVRKWYEPKAMAQRPVAVFVGALAVVLTVFSLSTAVGEQLKLTSEMDDVMKEFDSSANGEVFYDVTRPSVTPSLLKTTVRALNEATPLSFINCYYNRERSEFKRLVILPSGLKGFRGMDRSSDDGSRKIMVYHGYVVVCDESLTPYESVNLSLVTDDGETVKTRGSAVPFHSADGHRYFWIQTHAQTLNPGMRVSGAVF